FFDVFPMRYSYVADHFQYLASPGPIALVVALGTALWTLARRSSVNDGEGGVPAAKGAIKPPESSGARADHQDAPPSASSSDASAAPGERSAASQRSSATLLASALPLIVLGTLTWRQCLIYKDPETLWRDTIAKNPGAW